MKVTKPHEFIRFGAMEVTKPYEFIRFGAMDVTKLYEFIWFGAMDVTKPYEFIRFGAGTRRSSASAAPDVSPARCCRWTMQPATKPSTSEHLAARSEPKWLRTLEPY
jgi:hypothetical protein